MVDSTLVIIFGLVIGSFLNVVIHRLPLEQSVVRPGSRCPSCGTGLKWFHNIPLIGFLLIRGKCVSCKAPVSWRYPLVEFLTAFLFWLSFQDRGLDVVSVISQFRIWLFIALGIAITFIDLDYRIIPDELSLGGWAAGAVTAAWDFRGDMVSLWIASVAGFGFFYLFALAYEKVTGRVGLGGGDIKFMGTIGVFLGLGGIWSSIMISSVVGSVAGIVVARLNRSEQALRTAIPYGPFLVLGALVELFFEVSKWIIR
jgi:leader peptidase (prepilin peptidase)/N-methyltransferase